MQKNRRVYRLSPSQLSAETIAVTFAKTSRSPKAFDEIASELDAEKSSKFSEKWIVGYGHASVAEHAVLHLALENVSRLAIETIEGNRLASYTEKSTRYQEWDPDAYVVPPEIIASPHEQLYRSTLADLFSFYARAIAPLRHWAEQSTPRLEGESEKAWENRARTQAIDVCRFILPAASMANVGVTMNARTLEYAIKKMLSSELAEVRTIGEEVKFVATQELPTLVKYANPMPYLAGIKSAFANQPLPVSDAHSDWCQLLEVDPQGEQKVLAALLYRFGHGTHQACLQQAQTLNLQQKQSLVAALFKDAGAFDVPLRELEFTSYTFDMVLDQGAYFEFKRHRMMTQTPQPLTTRLGFAMPKMFVEASLDQEFIHIMRQTALAYEQLATWNAEVASYIVPNAFNRRILFSLNLRELFHFSRIRCNANAHFSIRRVGRGMLEKITPHHPLFTQHLCVDCAETSASITENYFAGVAIN